MLSEMSEGWKSQWLIITIGKERNRTVQNFTTPLTGRLHDRALSAAGYPWAGSSMATAKVDHSQCHQQGQENAERGNLGGRDCGPFLAS